MMSDKCKNNPCHEVVGDKCFCKKQEYLRHLCNCEGRGKGKHNTGEFECKEAKCQ